MFCLHKCYPNYSNFELILKFVYKAFTLCIPKLSINPLNELSNKFKRKSMKASSLKAL